MPDSRAFVASTVGLGLVAMAHAALTWPPRAAVALFAGGAAVAFVAEAEESVIGFAHAFVDPEEVTLLRLYVYPDSRGEGAGRELFEALVERATEAGVDRLRATALAANDSGAAFYRAMGLERVATDETTIAGETYPEHTFLLEMS